MAKWPPMRTTPKLSVCLYREIHTFYEDKHGKVDSKGTETVPYWPYWNFWYITISKYAHIRVCISTWFSYIKKNIKYGGITLVFIILTNN